MLGILTKPIIILLIIAAVASGTYFYVKKTNPGLVLGTTTEVTDFISEKIPQTKPFLEKLALQTTQKNTENTSTQSNLEKENKFLQESLDMTTKQLEVLKQKSTEVKDHLVTLSEEIKESSSGSEMQQKAFEYGQYVYYQQVIKKYETP